MGRGTDWMGGWVVGPPRVCQNPCRVQVAPALLRYLCTVMSMVFSTPPRAGARQLSLLTRTMQTRVVAGSHRHSPNQISLSCRAFALTAQNQKFAFMPNTCEEKRWEIVFLHKKNIQVSEIARQCHVSRGTVQRIISLWKATRSVKPKPKPGRKRVVSEHAARRALQLLTTKACGVAERAAHQLHREGLAATVVHRTTIGRAARRAAAAKRRELVVHRGKPHEQMSQPTIKQRLRFEKQHRAQDWRSVMFTDRKRFVFRHPGASVSPVRYLLLGDEDTAPMAANIKCLNVYAGITWWGMTTAREVAGSTGQHSGYNTRGRKEAKNITKKEYLEAVLPNTLLPEGERLFRGNGVTSWVLQQDNDPCHKGAKGAIAAYCRRYSSSISLLDKWPPHSPDLNPIENVWAWVQARVNKQGCETFPQFRTAVLKALGDLTPRMCRKYIGSMQHRLKELVLKKGGKTGH